MLHYDPRAASPSEMEARSELAWMTLAIVRALTHGGLDETKFAEVCKEAGAAGRAARAAARSAHTRWVALPVDADLRAFTTRVRDEEERRLRRRISELHASGSNANAIALRLGLDPETVRRKLR